MEVILTKDVNKIGRLGSVVKVKDGFARNFLFPNGLAIEANASNMAKLEQNRKKLERDQEKKKEEAEFKKAGCFLPLSAHTVR